MPLTTKKSVLLLCYLGMVWVSGAADDSVVASRRQELVEVRIKGTSPFSAPAPLTAEPLPSHYFTGDGEPADSFLKHVRGQYREVYPGVDMACYGDDRRMEYVFRLGPGAHPSVIRIRLPGGEVPGVGGGGDIVVPLQYAEMVQRAPVICYRTPEGKTFFTGAYSVSDDGEVAVELPPELSSALLRSRGALVMPVPGGGQPRGPSHDFYMSKYEVTSEEFLRFLNDAEANPLDARGAFMFFDDGGNVWFNPAMRKGRDEAFVAAGGNLTYDRRSEPGKRYSHVAGADGLPAFVRHPVTGVSWYGALKYCNWLTIASGRGADQRCYTEGTNSLDWAPVTATNWAKGHFEDDCRARWLAYRGFRLPMGPSVGLVMPTSEFSEFSKTAGWNGSTNVLYGFGRSVVGPADANYREKGKAAGRGTMPVGSFSGRVYGERFVTHRNENFYGVYDLSGNVEEWLNDAVAPGAPGARLRAGGGWAGELYDVTVCREADPWTTDRSCGFRAMTTYVPPETMLVHILYEFYMEAPGMPAGEKVEEPEGIIAGEKKDGATGRPAGEEAGGISFRVGVEDSGQKGILYKAEPAWPPQPPPPPSPPEGPPGEGPPTVPPTIPSKPVTPGGV